MPESDRATESVVEKQSDRPAKLLDAVVFKKGVLALSGGGFRATLFHLGTLAVLMKNRLVNNDTAIIGVSGGAILTAHASLDYAKRPYAKLVRQVGDLKSITPMFKEIVALTRSDLRNRVFRRWLMFWITAACELVRNRHS